MKGNWRFNQTSSYKRPQRNYIGLSIAEAVGTENRLEMTSSWKNPLWWAIDMKNWCFWIVVLEETLESPLDCKENKPIHFEGNQPWVLPGRTDPEAEAPILWPSHEKAPWKRPWCWERVRARGEGGRQRKRWMDRVFEATNMKLTQLREAVEDRRAWRALVHGVTKSRTWLND